VGKLTVLIGLAGGAAAMYLLDPDHGNSRRARVSDEVQRLREKLSDEEGHVAPRDILNRTKESVSDFRHRFSNGQREKVTSEIREAASELGSMGRWSPSTRILAAAAGSGLALYGIRRTSLVGLGMTAAGLGLLARAITNFELSESREEKLHADIREQPREQGGARRSREEREYAPETEAPNAAELRDRAAEEEVTAFIENPDSIPSD
jgi:gas vesicle protein